MPNTIPTPLGEQAIIVLPGHGPDDAWWACLDRTPPQLAAGGPTVATGRTPEMAAGALAGEIGRYLRHAA